LLYLVGIAVVGNSGIEGCDGNCCGCLGNGKEGGSIVWKVGFGYRYNVGKGFDVVCFGSEESLVGKGLGLRPDW
jgi:hypothetical protein